jgi:hypothetical protein
VLITSIFNFFYFKFFIDDLCIHHHHHHHIIHNHLIGQFFFGQSLHDLLTMQLVGKRLELRLGSTGFLLFSVIALVTSTLLESVIYRGVLAKFHKDVSLGYSAVLFSYTTTIAFLEPDTLWNINPIIGGPRLVVEERWVNRPAIMDRRRATGARRCNRQSASASARDSKMSTTSKISCGGNGESRRAAGSKSPVHLSRMLRVEKTNYGE